MALAKAPASGSTPGNNHIPGTVATPENENMSNSDRARSQILNTLKRQAKPMAVDQPALQVELQWGQQESFQNQLKSNGADCERVADSVAALAAVDALIKRNGWHPLPVIAPGLLQKVQLANRWDSIHTEVTEAGTVAVSEAYCGIADTGSLVCLSSPDNPTSLNFLAEHHVVFLPGHRIVAGKRDVWKLMQAEGIHTPRAINLISGPSRTADIEQTIQLGAHGPRSLTVFLLDQLNP
ncbi:MAG: hypothetical protein CMK83_16460 [Pseudomonadales bacterium]|nr:hypothetical protein [Pseudomonadales bacterium]MAQ25797.1 hypothetical protein [Pseudomonadales bacterium]MBI28100.1 hypothetical protein [Pseudomonadales bacterium]HAU13796.1 hypothetical protein [Gammaproteobacteria bacterium]HBO91705.1 hypothetical protein [Gammaproteobacteria bacterium]